MFDIQYFTDDPRPFFRFAKEIWPGQYEPSLSHYFIAELERREQLLRNYTQNIDSLEHLCPIKRLIQCHGSFSTATCRVCQHSVSSEEIKDEILLQKIPYCPKCPSNTPEAILKPDIVFFGEALSDEFHKTISSDREKCDLLIVMGSSLKVRDEHAHTMFANILFLGQASFARLRIIAGECSANSHQPGTVTTQDIRHRTTRKLRSHCSRTLPSPGTVRRVIRADQTHHPSTVAERSSLRESASIHATTGEKETKALGVVGRISTSASLIRRSSSRIYYFTSTRIERSNGRSIAVDHHGTANILIVDALVSVQSRQVLHILSTQTICICRCRNVFPLGR